MSDDIKDLKAKAKFKSGFDEVQNAIDRQKASGSKDYVPMLVWKDDRNGKGEQYEHVVRFMPDEVITCEVYDFIKCDDDSVRTFVSPASVGLDIPDYFEEHPEIELRDYAKKVVDPAKYRREITLGLCVLREETQEKVGGRTKMSVRDKTATRTYEDKEGKTQTVENARQYFLIKQGLSNFWNMFMTHNRRNNGLFDRDYLIERQGNDKKTSYSVVPLDVIDGLDTEEDVRKVYDDQPLSLEDWVIARLATAEVCEPLLGKYKGKGSPEGASDEKNDDVATTPLSDEGADEAQTVESSANTRMSSLRDQMTKGSKEPAGASS